MCPILLSTGSLYTYPLEDSFRYSHLFGFDGIELKIQDFDIDIESAKKLSREYGQDIRTVHSPFFKDCVAQYFSSPASTARKILLKTIDTATKLDAKIIVAHVFPTFNPIISKKRGIAIMKKTLREVKKEEIAIAIENMPIFTPPLIGKLGIFRMDPFCITDPRELLTFADRENLFITLDTSHAASKGLHPHKLLEILHERVVNIHISDYAKGIEHLPLGSGELNFEHFFEKINEYQYKNYITLELSPEKIKKIEDLKESLEKIKSLL